MLPQTSVLRLTVRELAKVSVGPPIHTDRTTAIVSQRVAEMVDNAVDIGKEPRVNWLYYQRMITRHGTRIPAMCLSMDA